MRGPLLLAANHPNSFLDAIIVASLFKSPVYSLAWGDAFAGRIINLVLHSLNMLPVYRVSEGAENLEHNYVTFDTCQRIFEQHKIVLIFSEGMCVNEWHLRPLKKGTARLAITAWQNKVPLKVLPLGINYSSFRKFGKNVILNFGGIISQTDISEDLSSGRAINEFNEKLQSQLKELVYEIDSNDDQKLKDYFYRKSSLLKKAVLFIPAIAGFILNAPLYLAVHLIIRKRAEDHYDSIMTGLLFLFYPLYTFLFTLITLLLTKSWYVLFLLILLPVFAWSYVQIKKEV